MFIDDSREKGTENTTQGCHGLIKTHEVIPAFGRGSPCDHRLQQRQPHDIDTAVQNIDGNEKPLIAPNENRGDDSGTGSKNIQECFVDVRFLLQCYTDGGVQHQGDKGDERFEGSVIGRGHSILVLDKIVEALLV